MYDFQDAKTPLNSIVLIKDHSELSQIRGEWKCTIECSPDDKTTAAICNTKYCLVSVEGQIRVIFSVGQWIFYPQSPGKVTAQFVRRAEFRGGYWPADKTSTSDYPLSVVEKMFSDNEKTAITAPEPGSISVNLDDGAEAIALYYGLNRSQISITIRDLQGN